MYVSVANVIVNKVKLKIQHMKTTVWLLMTPVNAKVANNE